MPDTTPVSSGASATSPTVSLWSCQERTGGSTSPSFQGRSRCHGTRSIERNRSAENWSGGAMRVGAGWRPNGPSLAGRLDPGAVLVQVPFLGLGLVEQPLGLAPLLLRRSEPAAQVAEQLVLVLAHPRDHESATSASTAAPTQIRSSIALRSAWRGSAGVRLSSTAPV
jgi:hypothetical protein